jgi:hypothetical protein
MIKICEACDNPYEITIGANLSHFCSENCRKKPRIPTIQEKVCCTCNEKKKVPDDFYLKTHGHISSDCRACVKIKMGSYRRRNHKEILRKSRERVKLLRGIIEKAKDVPCVDCGRLFPSCCMDFDHRDPTQKGADVSDLVHKHTRVDTLTKEIEKCEVVCACCHRIRTYKNNAYTSRPQGRKLAPRRRTHTRIVS